MKLSPMLIQGLWEFKSPLLQLPHLTEDNLKYFQTKKRYIKSLQQFAKLPPEESRALLRNLTEEEYDNVIKVLSRMPLIDFSIRCEVVDDDNTNIVTAGAIVTVTVNLERRSMRELLGDIAAVEKPSINVDENTPADENAEGDVVDNKEDAKQDNKSKKPVWLKQKGHKGKSKSKPKNKGQLNTVQKPAATTAAQSANKENSSLKANQKPVRDDSDDSAVESDNDMGNERDDDRSSDNDDDKKVSSVEDDDMEWEK